MLGANCDVAVVGGGIVGLATALALSTSRPDLDIVVLEKESQVAAHQTGHNSGVIHSGVYYAPGSLKAQLSREGSQRLVRFCDEHGLRYEICGKIIVAVDERELPVLRQIYERGQRNGVPGLRWLNGPEVQEIEPHAAAVAAVYSPYTGIVSFREVAVKLAELLKDKGVRIYTNACVEQVRWMNGRLTLETSSGHIGAKYLVNCAGLHADRVARLCGVEPEVQIVPFRGEYYRVLGKAQSLVRGLIYPVPDPQFPFLGVHLTRTIHGDLEAGPNAVLAFAREGYSRRIVHFQDLLETLRYSGFRELAKRHWRAGLYEMYRSFSKRAFLRSIQRLVPAITANDIEPAGAGVRAQALYPDGRLVEDFHIRYGPRSLHVLNAPSPAATSSLAIGDRIAAMALKEYEG